jgi:hypothetical protein
LAFLTICGRGQGAGAGAEGLTRLRQKRERPDSSAQLTTCRPRRPPTPHTLTPRCHSPSKNCKAKQPRRGRARSSGGRSRAPP